MSARLTSTQIAWRAAQDITDGAYVNLGIGFPEMVARFQPPGRQAIFHTENGILNFVAFDAAGKRVRFGTGLTESEAERCVEAIWGRYPQLLPRAERLRREEIARNSAREPEPTNADGS